MARCLRRLSLSDNGGFSLIEMVVSVFVVATISSIFLANYRHGDRQSALSLASQRLASDIRLMQNNSLGLVDFHGTPPSGGWGVYFDAASSTNYILFADTNENHRYDGAGETYSRSALPSSMFIKEVEGSSVANVSIVFFPPDPETFFYGTNHVVPDNHSSSYIVLGDNASSTKRIDMNFFGSIEVSQ